MTTASEVLKPATWSSTGVQLIARTAFLAYLAYFVTGSLQIGISKIFLVIYLLSGAVLAPKTFSRGGKVDSFVAVWSILLMLHVLSMIWIFVSGERDPFFPTLLELFRTILFVSLSFYIGYVLAKYKVLTEIGIQRVGLFLFVLFVSLYAYELQSSRSALVTQVEQVNAVYGLVFLLPFAGFIRSRLLGTTAVLLIFLVGLSSLKRGAVITLAGGSGIYFAYKLFLERGNMLAKTATFALAVLAISLGIWALFANELMVSRFVNVVEDGGSQREAIFKAVLNSWYESDWLTKVFGRGLKGALVTSGVGVYAHNDILDQLANFGLLGVGLYLTAFVLAVRVCRRAVRERSPHALPLAMILVMWALDSQYQQWYNSLNAASSVGLLGFVLASAKASRKFPRKTRSPLTSRLGVY